MPLLHLRVLEYLLQFLARVSEQADVNKMHAHNLAVVIAPNILHSRPDDDAALVQNSGHVNTVVQIMIERVATMFEVRVRGLTHTHPICQAKSMFK